MARRPVHISKTALSPRKRATLRASDFAVPSERKYPINDLFHARLALTYVLTPSNAAYRDEVVRAVLARYPELQFWWASRSKGVEAKRSTRKTTSRRMPGQRMVANPRRRNPAADPFAAVRRATKKEVARYADAGGSLPTFAMQRLMDAAYRVYNTHLTMTGEQLPIEEVHAEIVEARTQAEDLRREHNREEARKLKDAYREEQRQRVPSLYGSRKNPGSGGKARTAAQSNAAKAMKLFHSGQASSLAEAWAMLRRR